MFIHIMSLVCKPTRDLIYLKQCQFSQKLRRVSATCPIPLFLADFNKASINVSKLLEVTNSLVKCLKRWVDR